MALDIAIASSFYFSIHWNGRVYSPFKYGITGWADFKGAPTIAFIVVAIAGHDKFIYVVCVLAKCPQYIRLT